MAESDAISGHLGGHIPKIMCHLLFQPSLSKGTITGDITIHVEGYNEYIGSVYYIRRIS